jgi:lipocalin
MENNQAVYTMGEDGIVNVKNSGVKNGELKEITGIAKTTKTPALLRVSFFKPFYADYRVLYIDDDYQYALVGCGSSDYLWILSRTPQLEDSAKEILLSEAVSRGYDINNFIWVKQ